MVFLSNATETFCRNVHKCYAESCIEFMPNRAPNVCRYRSENEFGMSVMYMVNHKNPVEILLKNQFGFSRKLVQNRAENFCRHRSEIETGVFVKIQSEQ